MTTTSLRLVISPDGVFRGDRDLETAMAATAFLVGAFEGLDSIQERAETLRSFRDPDHLPERSRAASELILSLVDEALEADRFVTAMRLLKDSASIFRGAKDPDLTKRSKEARAKVVESMTSTDGKRWASAWTYTGEHHEHKVEQGTFNGRDDVWVTHPPRENSSFVWKRTVMLERKMAHALEFDVSARAPPPEAHGKPIKDFTLVVKANGEELLSEVIGGSRWQSTSVDLTKSGGFAVNLELHNKTGGQYPWYEEYAHWDNVRVVSTP